MKNMYNEIMKEMNERFLLSDSSPFPYFLLTKEEKERQEFEKTMLMMKTGTILSSPSSANPFQETNPMSAIFSQGNQFGNNPYSMNSLINGMPSSSNNPMMNMMMQMMRNQMTNGQSTGGQSMNQVMMNSMGNGMNPIMGIGESLMGGNLMGMNDMTRGGFRGSEMGAMGATPFQMPRNP